MEELVGVTVRREPYASDIRIRANPEDTEAGSISMEIHRLEYFDDTSERMDHIATIGETVGDFMQREFVVGDKTITGVEIVSVIKQYVLVLLNRT